MVKLFAPRALSITPSATSFDVVADTKTETSDDGTTIARCADANGVRTCCTCQTTGDNADKITCVAVHNSTDIIDYMTNQQSLTCSVANLTTACGRNMTSNLWSGGTFGATSLSKVPINVSDTGVITAEDILNDEIAQVAGSVTDPGDITSGVEGTISTYALTTDGPGKVAVYACRDTAGATAISVGCEAVAAQTTSCPLAIMGIARKTGAVLMDASTFTVTSDTSITIVGCNMKFDETILPNRAPVTLGTITIT